MEKRLFLQTFFWAFVLSLASCSGRNGLESPPPSSMPFIDALSEYGHIFTDEELIDYASTTVPALFSADVRTKSAGKTVSEAVRFSDTRWMRAVGSESGTSLLENTYIVNYDDDGGFAIINADNRVDHVVAYSEKGNIRFDSNVDPESSPIRDGEALLGDFTIDDILELLPYYYEWLGMTLIPWPVFGRDSIDANGYYYCNPEFHYSRWITTEEEYASTSSQWGQGTPYNDLFLINDPFGQFSFYAPTGCVTIAIGQIMHKFAWPASTTLWGGNTTLPLSWSAYGWNVTAEEDSNHALASLLREVADSLHSIYSPTTTSAQGSVIKPVLSHYGFSYDNPNTSYMDSYSYTSIKASINSGYPVITAGYSSPENIDGHCWLIEGYSCQLRHRLIDWDVYGPDMTYRGRWTSIYPTGEEYADYVYCNWGYNGQYNGLFISGLFNTNTFNYSYNTKIITGIHH